jgi:hypothetical protein
VSSPDARYVAWFHELDAWTEYWDVYHPESRGRYYFGDGASEPGLLTRILPNPQQRPPLYLSWRRHALSPGNEQEFAAQARAVAAEVLEVDGLVARLFDKHFGDAADAAVQDDYLEAMFRFAVDSLPPSDERRARLPDDDARRRTAGRHTLDDDLMWFGWALHLEAAEAVAGPHPRRALQLAGVVSGCAANFAWRGHRRTRPEFRADEATRRLLRDRGLGWARDFPAAAAEIHALFRIREWGHE